MKHTDRENTYNIEARIYSNSGNGYGHIYIDFFYINLKNEKCFCFHELSNYQISAQFNINDEDETYNKPYAWRIESQDKVDLENFKKVYKFMSMVEKKYNKLCATFETPKEFYQYVNYILNCLGIENIIYNDCNRQANDLKYIINNMVEKESTPTYKINNQIKEII